MRNYGFGNDGFVFFVDEVYCVGFFVNVEVVGECKIFYVGEFFFDDFYYFFVCYCDYVYFYCIVGFEFKV